MKGTRARGWRGRLQVVFALAGVLFVSLIVRHAGDELWTLVLKAAAILPWIALLEAIRIGLEAVATWHLLGRPRGNKVVRSLMRAQLVSYSVANVMPAGRAAGEGVKATMLTHLAPAGRCVAAATAGQAVSLLAVAAISVPTLVLAWMMTQSSAITAAIAATGGISLAGGILIQLAGKHRSISRVLERRLPRLAPQAKVFQENVAAQGLLPLGAFVPALMGRLIQIAQFWLLAVPLGVPGTLPTAVVTNGINLAGSAMGDFVPAHVGFSEAALAVSAESLGIGVASAVALALLVHVVQLAWAALGFIIPLLWKTRPPLPSDFSKAASSM